MSHDVETMQQHFLLVTFPAQGHINPARELAHRLARTAGARVTITTGISAYRRMFPSTTAAYDHSDQMAFEHDDGLVSYLPYDDNLDNEAEDGVDNVFHRLKLAGSPSLSALISGLAARGRPVTFLIYTILLTWAADVAHEYRIPSSLFWVQAAAVFVLYHRYFHGHAELISAHKDDPSYVVHLPGLPALRLRDLPSFLTLPSDAQGLFASIRVAFEEMFRALDEFGGSRKQRQRVLVNTFDALEPDALAAVDEMELLAVGPVVSGEEGNVTSGSLLEEDGAGYMEWLDSKVERSVVYVSFGSFMKMSRRQMGEMAEGLADSGRPHLWVVRKDNREGEEVVEGWGSEKGMVVEWCSQVAVLSHRSIGCFVTHCGWNSMTESLVCGVPMVMVPQGTDQPTNARLAEGVWGTGVRAVVDEDGVMEGSELKRCLDLVMGDGEDGRAAEMRRMAATWRDKARDSTSEGGSSDRNVRAFIRTLSPNSSYNY